MKTPLKSTRVSLEKFPRFGSKRWRVRVDGSDCDSCCRGFESHQPPQYRQGSALQVLFVNTGRNSQNGNGASSLHLFRALFSAAAILAITLPAHAETDVLLMGKSWHFGHQLAPGRRGYDVNQYNWGGGLEYRGNAWHGQWLVGGLTYRDTFRQQAYTVYGGYQFTVPVSSDVAVFATVRAGYLNGSGHHGPGALPSIGVTYKRLSIEATYIPPAAKEGYNCVAIFGRIAF